MMELKEKGKKHPEVMTEARAQQGHRLGGRPRVLRLEAQFLERLPDASAPRQPVARWPNQGMK